MDLKKIFDHFLQVHLRHCAEILRFLKLHRFLLTKCCVFDDVGAVYAYD